MYITRGAHDTESFQGGGVQLNRRALVAARIIATVCRELGRSRNGGHWSRLERCRKFSGRWGRVPTADIGRGAHEFDRVWVCGEE